MRALQKTALYPNGNAPVLAKDLEVAIAHWEGDIQRWEAASGERMLPSQRKLCLEEMCPERLRAHLRLIGPDKLHTYEAMRAEIADWLAEDLRKPTRQRVAALGPATSNTQEWAETEDNAEWDLDVYAVPQEELENFDREQRLARSEQLMALVKNIKSKQSRKGGGKGGKGGKGPRKCFECDTEGHIASECPIRLERVKNGGPERLPRTPKGGDVSMDGTGGKGKGKGGGGKSIGSKGTGKSAPPTKGTWQTYNPQGFFRKPQWAQWYPGKAPQLSMAEEGGDWMATPGMMLGLRYMAPKPQPVLCSNKFEVLQKMDEELSDDCESSTDSLCWGPIPERKVNPMVTPAGGSRGEARLQMPVGTRGSKKRLCKPREAQCAQDCCGTIRGTTDTLDHGTTDTPDHHPTTDTLDHNSSHYGTTDTLDHHYTSGPKLSVLSEKRPAQSLMPVSSNDWEYVEFIFDSGATTTVIPATVGRAYEIQPSESSKAGVMYEIANGDEIPNLGEKLMPVVTAEGAWKGLLAQVADISKALQSVRSLVRAGHAVVFGDDDDEGGTCSYIVNKVTGEYTSVKDDGVNYFLGLYIAPKHEAGFVRPEAR